MSEGMRRWLPRFKKREFALPLPSCSHGLCINYCYRTAFVLPDAVRSKEWVYSQGSFVRWKNKSQVYLPEGKRVWVFTRERSSAVWGAGVGDSKKAR